MRDQRDGVPSPAAARIATMFVTRRVITVFQRARACTTVYRADIKAVRAAKLIDQDKARTTTSPRSRVERGRPGVDEPIEVARALLERGKGTSLCRSRQRGRAQGQRERPSPAALYRGEEPAGEGWRRWWRTRCGRHELEEPNSGGSAQCGPPCRRAASMQHVQGQISSRVRCTTAVSNFAVATRAPTSMWIPCIRASGSEGRGS